MSNDKDYTFPLWLIIMLLALMVMTGGCASMTEAQDRLEAEVIAATMIARDECATFKYAQEQGMDTVEHRDTCTRATYKACRLGAQLVNHVWIANINGYTRQDAKGWALKPRQMRREIFDNGCRL